MWFQFCRKLKNKFRRLVYLGTMLHLELEELNDSFNLCSKLICRDPLQKTRLLLTLETVQSWFSRFLVNFTASFYWFKLYFEKHSEMDIAASRQKKLYKYCMVFNALGGRKTLFPLGRLRLSNFYMLQLALFFDK